MMFKTTPIPTTTTTTTTTTIQTGTPTTTTIQTEDTKITINKIIEKRVNTINNIYFILLVDLHPQLKKTLP